MYHYFQDEVSCNLEWNFDHNWCRSGFYIRDGFFKRGIWYGNFC